MKETEFEAELTPTEETQFFFQSWTARLTNHSKLLGLTVSALALTGLDLATGRTEEILVTAAIAGATASIKAWQSRNERE